MILLIDNYDSFTWNLVHYLGQLGATVEVFRNDEITVDQAMSRKPKAVVLSPGPCDPDKAGICMDLIRRAGEATPILGMLGSSIYRSSLRRKGHPCRRAYAWKGQYNS